MPLVSLKRQEMEVIYSSLRDNLYDISQAVEDLQNDKLYTSNDAEQLADRLVHIKKIMDKLSKAYTPSQTSTGEE